MLASILQTEPPNQLVIDHVIGCKVMECSVAVHILFGGNRNIVAIEELHYSYLRL